MVSSPLSALERERTRETERTGEREREGERALGLMQLGAAMRAQGRCTDDMRHLAPAYGRPRTSAAAAVQNRRELLIPPQTNY